MTLMRAIGLMSGTSMDGVDVALIETDGENRFVAGPTGFKPYGEDDRALLRKALAEAVTLTDRTARPGRLAEAERLVTQAHVEAVRGFMSEHGVSGADVLGFHGQTVLHRPEQRLTVQIGDGAALARALGLNVVYDMRAADVAAGGQGAPLVPVFHRALVAAANLDLPVGVLNLGGVGNVTLVRNGDPLSCDTGPANALIDDLMLERTGVPMDRDGATAARGRIDEAALAALMAHPFFDQKPPKSLDRNAFSRAPVAGLSTEDAAATLTAFTAASVAASWKHLAEKPKTVIVCGGGARNPTLLRMLSERLPCAVQVAEDFGWKADAVEAQAFGYLAVRSLKGLPLTFPTTTGAPVALTGGVLARP
jgi:anhydro-N-acetylmuramic acid kinase